MKKYLYGSVWICLALSTVALLRMSTPPDPVSTATSSINALLGDESYKARYGVAPASHTPDSLRIRTHLEYVFERLGETSSAGMTQKQLQRRVELLGHLADYLEAGRFPHNDGHPAARRPTFIDTTGAICAVGYLVEKTAGRAVAEQVAARHKYAFIPEIDDPVFLEWVDASGFTIQELAMIQPQYGPSESQVTTNKVNQVEPAYILGSFALAAAQATYWLGGFESGASHGRRHVVGAVSGAASVVLGLVNLDNTTSTTELVLWISPCDGCPSRRETRTTNPMRTNLSAGHVVIGGATVIRSAIGLMAARRNRAATERHRLDVVGLQAGLHASEPVPALSWKMRF